MKNDPPSTVSRKDDHLALCSTEDVAGTGHAGWDLIELPHCALPDLDLAKINISAVFLGQTFSSPVLISSMTGGSSRGERINQVLAEFAQAANIPMGVGSQRIALEQRTTELFNLRKFAPKSVLYANIGAVQLNYGVSCDDCIYLVDKLQAQALILHLNPLQEAIQAEGDHNFAGLWPKISELCTRSPVPVILKETGCGLDHQTCVRAKNAGISAIDIAGFGGTHWGYIEGLRNSERLELGQTFRGWGIPSAEALMRANVAVGNDLPIIASGGVRSGLDIAKAIYLGASLVGLALPFLKAAEEAPGSLEKLLSRLNEAIRIALFCTNSGSLDQLRKMGGEVLYEDK